MVESSSKSVVDKQLTAYNSGDFETFASCYHEDITSYDLETSKPNPQMSGDNFFAHYKKKFIENPKIHCHVTQRMFHGDFVIDKEIITDYRNQKHTELVIYQIEQGRISKMWFTDEIAEEA